MNTMTSSDIQTAHLRAKTYELLSALFCQPEADVHGDHQIYQMLNKQLAELHSDLRIDPALSEYPDRMKPEELLVEYTKLFLGPFYVLAQPYSSMYYSEPGMMTPVTQWVESYYQACGFQFDIATNDLPDHIAAELAFMSQLAGSEYEAQNIDDLDNALRYHNYQAMFMDSHLIQWIPKYCDAIRQSKTSVYYTALADLLESFIEWDKIQLAPDSKN